MYINYSRTDAVIITFFILYLHWVKSVQTPYLDTSHAVLMLPKFNVTFWNLNINVNNFVDEPLIIQSRKSLNTKIPCDTDFR